MIGIVMDETVARLLIAISSVLLVVAAAAVIGLVSARRLDSKNVRNSSNCPPRMIVTAGRGKRRK
jgi:hypothetical protein